MRTRYRLPLSVVLPLVRDGLSGARRDFKRDAQACLAMLSPQLRVEGGEHIPPGGPLLVTVNHFARPGYHPWWHAMAITAALPVPAHWIMTAEWTAPGKWYGPLKSALSRFAARRIARTYGFTTMPPMPPRPHEVEARVRAVRAILALAAQVEDLVLCLAPEGADAPGGALTWPPAGAGRMIGLLSTRGLRLLPVGAWEQEGRLWVRFGPAYQLPPDTSRNRDEQDHRAAEAVMRRIAALLPPALRGDFR